MQLFGEVGCNEVNMRDNAPLDMQVLSIDECLQHTQHTAPHMTCSCCLLTSALQHT